MRDINKVLSKGFTLIEIMTVVVIFGVISGLAVPTYVNQMEQTRANEAQVNLNTIFTAEKVYKAKNGTYWAAPANPTIDQINQGLGIDLATPQFYPITAIVAGTTGSITTSFTATARRNGGSWDGKVASINETGFYTPPPS